VAKSIEEWRLLPVVNGRAVLTFCADFKCKSSMSGRK
jgi:hypothetical protein